MATLVVAQLCAAVRWFGADSLGLIYVAVVPLLIPLVLSFASLHAIKRWLIAAVIVSAAILLVSLLCLPAQLSNIYLLLPVWTSLIIWFYWGYREFRGLFSVRRRERNINDR